ncbi:MAG: polysaccharide biosynthesis/export family protein [Thalassotalea sp.]
MLFNFKHYQKIAKIILCYIFLSTFNIHAEDYKIGPGDTLLIDVYDEKDLQVNVRINKSGIVTFPFLGDIQVIGRNSKEIALIIESGLRGDYLIDPQVNVSITHYRPFYINGMVNRPGGYPFQEGLTLDKAIALSGGFASRASKSDWKITRIVDNKTVLIDAQISTEIFPDDIINIGQSFF